MRTGARHAEDRAPSDPRPIGIDRTTIKLDTV